MLEISRFDALSKTRRCRLACLEQGREILGQPLQDLLLLDPLIEELADQFSFVLGILGKWS